jgi:carbon-monoxide dehydrogenase small subunit
MLAADLDGRRVETIEGLQRGGELHPLQVAFWEHNAFQCGFCTPGFLMMAKALLDDVPNPTPEQVRDWLDGNLCRCTGYRPIETAVLAASSSEGDR